MTTSDNQRRGNSYVPVVLKNRTVPALQHLATGRARVVAIGESGAFRASIARGGASIDVPDTARTGERFVRKTATEQLRAALPVLLAARRLVVLEGWQPIAAIQEAGGAEVECWWARSALASVVSDPNLTHWQLDSSVLASDKTRAFDRAIRLARRALGHKGGWSVSTARAA